METLIAVVLGIVGLVVAALGYRQGTASERERSRKLAESTERARREQAAKDAGVAMKESAAQRDRELRRPATDFLTEEARKGGKP